MRLPFSTRDPYPSWYRRSPIAVLMPWRNLGCLGIRLFGFYADAYRTWHFPWFGLFVSVGGGRYWPMAKIKIRSIKWFREIHEHAASWLAELQWEQGTAEPISRWTVYKYHLQAAWLHLRMAVAALYCQRFGHRIEAEDFVDAEYAEDPDDGLEHPRRIVDIHGGGVDWHCTRCGVGGRSRF